MGVTVHLVRGSFAELIPTARERAGASPGSVLWLAASVRARDAHLQALTAGQPYLLDLHAATLGDWIEQVLAAGEPAVRPLAAAQQRLLLEEVVQEVHRWDELRHFRRVLETRGFSSGLRDLIAELKRLGIRPGRFAQAAYARGYDGDAPARTIRGRAISSKDRECARLYARYEKRLELQRLLDVEGRPGYAARLLRERGLPPCFRRVRAVFLAGFSDFSPAQFDVVALLARHVSELWVALPDEEGDLRSDLFATARATATSLATLGVAVDHWVEGEDARPAGLRHVAAQLFRPLRQVESAATADGLRAIEAPGRLGESRLVVRAVKELLDSGTRPDDVLLVARDLDEYADLLAEVAGEYGVPLDVEGTEPLPRVGVIATLLRALRLPLEDWPFAGTTAILRSIYLRPRAPEVIADPDVATRSEVLLRLLGEPRDREAYLRAVARWEKEQQAGLEDEQAEESRRRRTHDLARRCGPFLRRFFALWDDFTGTRRLGDHLTWLRRFLHQIGFDEAARGQPRDQFALARLSAELERWRERVTATGADVPFDAATFVRRLTILAGELGLARSPRGPGRVRLLSADLARGLSAGHVFLVGLGEGSFPRATGTPFFDESDRQAFRASGLPFPETSAQLPAEMLLFYQVVTSATRSLTLSYPAVDERGQELLPSSFLVAVRSCFADGAIPTTRRRMLIESLTRDVPLSLAELRVHLIGRTRGNLASEPSLAELLPEDACANLQDAALLVHHRFHVTNEHTVHDGLLQHPAILARVAELFGPGRVFSPTALEDYVACPFKFFARHVLRLDPLEAPREEIEVTRRGQAFHRAMAGLHRRLKEEKVTTPGAVSHRYLSEEIAEAVREDIARAPSAAARELWRLEGIRLARQAGRYGDHWQQFLTPWQERAIAPCPDLFEVDFGLPSPDGAPPPPALVVTVGGVSVRVSGRIDRVDQATLPGGGVGFWIIDYKTGRAGHYTGGDLLDFRKLQLTLYALAVQEILLRDRAARPLGLVYWLVSEKGPKVVVPASRDKTVWLDETEPWAKLRRTLETWIGQLGEAIRTGYFALAPRSRDCTATCAYGQVCRISQARAVGKPNRLALPVVE